MNERKNPVSLKDIADALGLSKATVSMALNDNPNVAAGTREKVKETADRMGYRPSGALKEALRSVRSGGEVEYRETIACLHVDDTLESQYRAVCDLSVSELSERGKSIASGLEAGAIEQGCAIDFFNLKDMPLQNVTRIIKHRGIRRILTFSQEVHTVLVQQGYFEKDIREALQDFACCNISYSPVFCFPGCHVLPGLFEAGRMAFRAAWLAGYRRFYLTSILEYLDTENRFEAGFQAAASHLRHLPNILRLRDGRYLNQKNKKDFETLLDQMGRDCCIVGKLRDDYMDCYLDYFRKPVSPAYIDWDVNREKEGYDVSGVSLSIYDLCHHAVERTLHQAVENADALSRISTIQPVWIDGRTLPKICNNHLNLLEDDPFEADEAEKMGPIRMDRLLLYRVRHYESLVLHMRAALPPAGNWVFHGAPFRIAGDRSETRLALLKGGGAQLPHLMESSLESSLLLKVNQKARSVYFLQAAAMAHKREKIATYRFRFASGRTVDVPVISHGEVSDKTQVELQAPPEVNIHDWYCEMGTIHNASTRPVQVLASEASPVAPRYFYVYRWENPFPREAIESIELLMESDTEALMMLYGVTLGQRA